MAGRLTILVLGGGINGAAIARELALNGVAVRLVDRADIASGATAYSSRLIHGGLRYLEFGEFGLVREALAERERLLQLAPQYVKPLRLYIPVHSRWGGFRAAAAKFLRLTRCATSPPPRRGLWVVSMGLRLYDWLAAGASLPIRQTHRVGAEHTPPVDSGQFRWLCSYSDAQISFPERFVVALLDDARRLSQEQGIEFEVFPYHQATMQDGVAEIRPCSGSAAGMPADAAAPIKAFRPDAVINATGAWVDHTLEKLSIDSRRLIGGTKGSHLLTANPQLAAALQGCGVYVEAADGRPVFMLPLDEFTLIGTTDLPFQQSPETAVASDEELNYLLRAANNVFPAIRLGREDITWSYSGVRPLPFVDRSSPAAVTRRHWLEEHGAGDVPVYSVVGGKLTTCRSLAEQTVRALLPRLGGKVVANSRQRPLPGGDDYPKTNGELTAVQARHAQQTGFAVEQIRAVWRLCGSQTLEILASGDDKADGQTNLDGTGLPLRFVREVIRREWVTRLADLVERRLMLLYHRELRAATLDRLARLLVEEGKLARSDLESEVAACRDRLQRHLGRKAASD